MGNVKKIAIITGSSTVAYGRKALLKERHSIFIHQMHKIQIISGA